MKAALAKKIRPQPEGNRNQIQPRGLSILCGEHPCALAAKRQEFQRLQAAAQATT